MFAQDTRGLLEIAEEAYRTHDDGAAAELFEDLAAPGVAEAQFYLARMYETGRGRAQSYAHALRWYRRAADARIPEAQNNLGRLYEGGLGVEADAREAERWFLAAARQGNEDAQLSLARLYAEGARSDRVRAYAWSLVAARRGCAQGATNAELIRASLTVDERIAGARESELLLESDSQPLAKFLARC